MRSSTSSSVTADCPIEIRSVFSPASLYFLLHFLSDLSLCYHRKNIDKAAD
jgi:hypothetical protein